MKFVLVFIAVAAMLLVAADESKPQRWDFEDAKVGGVPKGWTSAKTGKGPGSLWKVLEDQSAPQGSKVLAQTSSEGPNRLFNLCVADDTSYADVDMTVSFKANRGKHDQGGGPVWRYQDANNYYICRHNPLEDNFRIYKVIAGKRIQLANLDYKADAGKWHTIRVVMRGEMIECSVDGRKLDVRDAAISKAGKVGLWTKADAVTEFDRFSVSEAIEQTGAQNVPANGALTKDVETLKDKATDQAHTMTDVDYHFSNLWFAAHAKNWPLADFYWKETLSHMRWAVRIIPVRKDSLGREIRLQDILQSIENSPFMQIGKTIEAKDLQEFAKAYRFTLEGCYSCHKAADKPYLRPQVPKRPASSIINFDPNASWPK